MGNRKLPFGYRMSLGEIVVQPAEAEVVHEIYRQYIAGMSLMALTKELRQQEIPYDIGRTWNKNMVDRILRDRRYIGEKEYPAIVAPEQMEAAAEIRNTKAKPPQKTAAQKELRRLCGASPSKRVEKSVTELFNGLIRCPELVRLTRKQPPVLCGKTQGELSEMLEQQPIDETAAKNLILRLAAERYADIGNEEYETVRLRRLFSSMQPSAELDAELLKSTVAKVIVTRESVQLKLKNGQTIERGEIQ